MKNESLGERIKSHRKRLNMTQEQLAERMGVSPQAVSKWENDLSCPDISVLPQLAEIFGITVDELLGGEAPNRTETVHEAIPVESEENTKDYNPFRVDKLSLPVWLLSIGGLLLARQLLRWDINAWTVVWTTALMVFGFFGMLERFSAFHLAMMLGGGVFLLNGLHILNLGDTGWSIVLPICLLILGVCLLVDIFVGKKWQRHGKKRYHGGDKERFEYHFEGGELDCDVSFTDRTIFINDGCFRGGDVDCAFANLVIDFSGLKTVSDGCHLDVDCSFGEVRMRIPSKFKVQWSEDTAFSKGVSVKGRPQDNAVGTIFMDCDISFGSIDVEYI